MYYKELKQQIGYVAFNLFVGCFCHDQQHQHTFGTRGIIKLKSGANEKNEGNRLLCKNKISLQS